MFRYVHEAVQFELPLSNPRKTGSIIVAISALADTITISGRANINYGTAGTNSTTAEGRSVGSGAHHAATRIQAGARAILFAAKSVSTYLQYICSRHITATTPSRSLRNAVGNSDLAHFENMNELVLLACRTACRLLALASKSAVVNEASFEVSRASLS
jgi:hypothetical protein